MDTRTTTRRRTVLLALLLAASAACGDENGGEKGKAAGRTAAVDGQIIPQPLAYAAFPVDSATILGWVAAVDTNDIRQHAWNLWGGLTSMTSQTASGDSLPVYETWLSRYEVYNTDAPRNGRLAATNGRPLDRGFHGPVQFHHSSVNLRAEAGGGGLERIVAGVKYNMPSAEHVWTNRYTDSARLTALNDGWPDTTSIANRNIVPFPTNAMAIKPVYFMISQTGLTVMPYWAGPDSSTTPSAPTPLTWTQFVAVDPTGQQVGQTVQVQANGQTYQARVIGLDQFYSFALTQDEVNDIITADTAQSTPLDPITVSDSIAVIVNGQQSLKQVGVGDYGVLVAMHVATKEIGNWTWQTFWWTPDRAANPLSSDQPASIQGPFKNFAMQQAYYMTVPSGPQQGQDQVTFNPYLETAFGESGLQSNCMSCHRTATWPGPTGPYPAFYGNVDPGNPAIFANQTKLDFLWSIQAGASTAQASLLRRIRSGSRAQPPASGGRDTGRSPQSAPSTPSGR
ncbi:MAG TPA: hypothetical protein VHG93_13385 [Longimicrobium sp.]|nr:hypothetical protein [Longimicrobium sp.]